MYDEKSSHKPFPYDIRRKELKKNATTKTFDPRIQHY